MQSIVRTSLFLFALFLISGVLSAQETFREKFVEGNILMDEQAHELAIDFWLDLVTEEPDNANVNYKTGLCYSNISTQKRLALPYFQKAVKNVSRNYDPNNSTIRKAPLETYYYLARAYHLNEELDSAERYFKIFLDQIGKKHSLRSETARHLETVANARELMQTPG